MYFKLSPLFIVNSALTVLLAILFAIFISPRLSNKNCRPKSLLAPGQVPSSDYESNNVAVYFPAFDKLVDYEERYPVIRTKESLSRGFKTEMLATLQAAQEYIRQGKYEKAERLFEHASQLQPQNPEVLTQYGYFVEKERGDVVAANLMYSLALSYSPGHLIASAHQKRTQPIVEEKDGEMLRLLDAYRNSFLRIPSGNSFLRRHMREAYFQHIYHTVAIEGNTMSLVQTRSLLETNIAVAGKSIMEHNEILGMDAAWKYVNQSLVNRFNMMGVQDILEIHRRVYGFVDPIEAGQFRRNQVYVGSFEPTPPEQIESEMDDLMSWLHSGVVRSVHPVEVAALLHYKFVIIHPFVDGNGRVSRLLMNLVLMQAGFPPVVIRLEDRLRYYETLETANQGDVRPFIRFIADATRRTLEEYLERTTVVGQHDAQREGLEDNRRTILPNA